MSSPRIRRPSLVAAVALVASLALAGTVASPAVASGTDASGQGPLDAAATEAPPDRTEVVNVTQRFRLQPSTPGTVAVELAIPAAEAVPGAGVDVAAPAHDPRILSVTGFERTPENGSAHWRTVADAEAHRVTYEIDVRDAITDFDWGTAGWAFFRAPTDDGTTVAVDGERVAVDYDHEIEAAGEGYVHGHYVALGENEVGRATVDGASITVVHPTAAETAASPQAVADQLAGIHRQRRAGELNESVVGFAHPRTDGTVAGYALDDTTFVVETPEDPRSLSNSWAHEYAHVTEGANTSGAAMAWFREGYARYAERLWMLHRGHGPYRDYRAYYDRVDDDPRTLADRDTWFGTVYEDGGANYRQGGLVLTAIDREVRTATDGNRTLAAVVAEMHRRDAVTLETFREVVADVAGPTVVERATTWITTDAVPDTWSRSAHEAAFGPVAEVRTNVTGLRARAGATERSLDRGTTPTLSPNETLVVEYAATNAGDLAADHATDTRVSVIGDGTVFRTTDRRPVGGGERVTWTTAYRFTEPGFATVQAGPHSFTVDVTLADVAGQPPRDLDGDGRYRDLNANGRLDSDDVVTYFERLDDPAIADHAPAYDYNGNGRADFDDVVRLFDTL